MLGDAITWVPADSLCSPAVDFIISCLQCLVVPKKQGCSVIPALHMRRNQRADLCQGDLYKAELGSGVPGEQFRCVKLQISQAVLSISQQPPLKQPSLLPFSIFCSLGFTPSLFFRFSCCSLELNTNQFLPEPLSSSSGFPCSHERTGLHLSTLLW